MFWPIGPKRLNDRQSVSAEPKPQFLQKSPHFIQNQVMNPMTFSNVETNLYPEVSRIKTSFGPAETETLSKP